MFQVGLDWERFRPSTFVGLLETGKAPVITKTFSVRTQANAKRRSMSSKLSLASLSLFGILFLRCGFCAAATISAPAGGAPIGLPDGVVVCADNTSAWLADTTGKKLRPPRDAAQIGKVTQLHVASSLTACATSKDVLQVVASGSVPAVDKKSVDLWVDEGRVELRGTGLDGSHLEWETKNERGSDVCVAPTLAGGQQACSYSIGKKLLIEPGGVVLRVMPAGVPAKASIYDAAANLVAAESLTAAVARWFVSSALTQDRHVDLSVGNARLALSHPEAIASADCESARCELDGMSVRISSVSRSVKALALKLRLTPHVFTRTNDGITQGVTIPLDVTYCPLQVVSLAPMRDNDDARVVVRVDARCNSNAESLRFTSNGNAAPVLDAETKAGDVYMLVALGRITTDKLVLAATRVAQDESLIGITTIKTVPSVQLRVSIHLPEFGPIDFVPTNRDASVSAVAPGVQGKIVILPVDGAYRVKSQDGTRCYSR